MAFISLARDFCGILFQEEFALPLLNPHLHFGSVWAELLIVPDFLDQ